MSGLDITVRTLLADARITDIVGQRVYPIVPAAGAKYPNIVVHLIHESDPDLLQGAAKFPESRVSIESRCDDIGTLYDLGQAVIDVMQDKLEYEIADCIATIRKEGTDGTDASDQEQPQGGRFVVRRITDFYIFWRRAG